MAGLRGRGRGVVGEIFAQLPRRHVLRWTWGTAAAQTSGCTKRVVVVFVVFVVVVVAVVTWVVVVKLLASRSTSCSSSCETVWRGRKKKRREVMGFDGHGTKEGRCGYSNLGTQFFCLAVSVALMAGRIVSMADLKPALGALHAVSFPSTLVCNVPSLPRSFHSSQSVSDAARALVEAEPPDEVTRAKRHALATANQKPVSKVARPRLLAVFQNADSQTRPSRAVECHQLSVLVFLTLFCLRTAPERNMSPSISTASNTG
jgi:hypothetical protein